MTDQHYADISKADAIVTVRTPDGTALLARSGNALELREFNRGKAYPPVYYIPRSDIDFSQLEKNPGHVTHCPIKGDASYFSLKGDHEALVNVAWSYENPVEAVGDIRGYLAFDGGQVTIVTQPADNQG